MSKQELPTAQDLQDELDLPQGRAERSVELMERLRNDSISKTEFLELSANVMIRREMKANDSVNRYGVKPFFGLEHLGTDGNKGPSVNQLLRKQFASVEDSDDVVEVSEQAQEEGKIYVSSNIVMFHADDVTVTEDGFEITPQTADEDEPAPATDEQESHSDIDVASQFV